MPFRLGTPELMILLVIVILLFGVGRIGRIASEMGRGIREFRRGLSDDEDSGGEKSKSDDEAKAQNA